MSLFDGKRIERVDLNPPRTRSPEPEHAGFSFSPAYCEDVWKLLKGAAEGTNVSTPQLPVDWDYPT